MATTTDSSTSPMLPAPRLRLPDVFACAWRLWRRAPLALTVLPLAPLLFELLVQPIPQIGMVLSKIGAMWLAVVVWFALELAWRRGAVRLRDLAAAMRGQGGRVVALVLLALVAVYGVQLLFAVALLGEVGWQIVALGQMPQTLGAADQAKLLAVIPFGMLPATLIAMVAPRMLFDARPLGGALADSIGVVLAHPGFFAGYILASMALLTAGMLTLVGLLAVIPLLSASGYVVYRALFPADTAEPHL